MHRSLTHSLPAKVAGIFLLVILAALIALSGGATLGGLYYGIYDRGVLSYYETNDCRSEMINDLHNIYMLMEDGVTDLSDNGYYNDFDTCNLRFAGYSFKTGQYLSNDAKMQNAMVQIVLSMQLAEDELLPQYAPDQYLLMEFKPDPNPQVIRSEDDYILPETLQWDIDDTWFIAGVVSPLSARDAYFRQNRLFTLVYNTRILAPILLAVCAFAAVADLIFLCCAAGHRWSKDEVILNFQDRIPLDVYLFTMGSVGFLLLIRIL